MDPSTTAAFSAVLALLVWLCGFTKFFSSLAQAGNSFAGEYNKVYCDSDSEDEKTEVKEADKGPVTRSKRTRKAD